MKCCTFFYPAPPKNFKKCSIVLLAQRLQNTRQRAGSAHGLESADLGVKESVAQHTAAAGANGRTGFESAWDAVLGRACTLRSPSGH